MILISGVKQETIIAITDATLNTLTCVCEAMRNRDGDALSVSAAAAVSSACVSCAVTAGVCAGAVCAASIVRKAAAGAPSGIFAAGSAGRAGACRRRRRDQAVPVTTGEKRPHKKSTALRSRAFSSIDFLLRLRYPFSVCFLKEYDHG